MHPPPDTLAWTPLLYEAVLRPHRSLSQGDFVALMVAVGAVSLAAGVACLLAGAWPVFGFFGLDALLLYLAFRSNFRAADLSERLELRDDALTVRRRRADGRETVWRFQPYWLRVRMDARPGGVPPLTLESHGRRLEVGAFLPPAQRLAVAAELRSALSRLGNPYARQP